MVLKQKKFESIDKIFKYKTEILKTVDSISSMWTFFYLRDLPQSFTDNFNIEQRLRFGNLIDMVKKGAELEMDQDVNNPKKNRNENHERSTYEMLYLENLNAIKRLLIKFIDNLDLHEVYIFVNHTPFLIDN